MTHKPDPVWQALTDEEKHICRSAAARSAWAKRDKAKLEEISANMSFAQRRRAEKEKRERLRDAMTRLENARNRRT